MRRDLVVIGGSAGGIEALREVLRDLPTDFPAAVLVVLHTAGRGEKQSHLARILGRATRLPVSHPADGERIEPGHIYVAPPDYHMMVKDDHVRILQGPRENRHRPAIDPLFRSVAVARGRRAAGVVLTGLLDDGTAGLMVLRAHGGAAVVQDPATALFGDMPRHALEQVPDACVLPVKSIGDELVRLVREELPEARPAATKGPAQTEEKETEFLEREMPEMADEIRPGRSSAFACPDCGGVLWEVEENGFLRFRCRVGHAFTALHLSAEQQHSVESSLWSALRALEESRALHQRLAQRTGEANHTRTAALYQEHADNLEQNARVLREFLTRVSAPAE